MGNGKLQDIYQFKFFVPLIAILFTLQCNIVKWGKKHFSQRWGKKKYPLKNY